MKYYKNKNNELFVDAIVENHVGLLEISEDEFNLQLEINNTPTAEQILQQKISETKQYLADTAWYIERFNDPSSGKDIPQDILDGRTQARLTINELEALQ